MLSPRLSQLAIASMPGLPTYLVQGLLQLHSQPSKIPNFAFHFQTIQRFINYQLIFLKLQLVAVQQGAPWSASQLSLRMELILPPTTLLFQKMKTLKLFERILAQARALIPAPTMAILLFTIIKLMAEDQYQKARLSLLAIPDQEFVLPKLQWVKGGNKQTRKLDQLVKLRLTDCREQYILRNMQKNVNSPMRMSVLFEDNTNRSTVIRHKQIKFNSLHRENTLHQTQQHFVKTPVKPKFPRHIPPVDLELGVGDWKKIQQKGQGKIRLIKELRSRVWKISKGQQFNDNKILKTPNRSEFV